MNPEPTTVTTILTTTVTTIPTTTKRPIPPMARAFVVCIKFKEVEGKILHNPDRKTAF
uniref:Uncharacterized protein n=1 Tax=Romanomermis culicivorax TaxID=13658 RepID=A0A915IPT7_ROMCU